MEFSTIIDFAGAVLGLVGVILLFSSAPVSIRMAGAAMFACLLPADILSAQPLLYQNGPAWLSVGTTSVAALGYIGLVAWTSRFVAKSAEVPARLAAYDKLLREQELKKPLLPAQVADTYPLPEDEQRYLVIVQGDIGDLVGSVVRPDVIVNSENAYLMLGRPFDKNISGVLRYLDAEKDEGQRIVNDSLEVNLRARLGATQLPVNIGSVFETPTTSLRKRGVKFIFHVATVTTDPTTPRGFSTPRNQLTTCVQNCFRKYGELLLGGQQIKTLLFPLIGAGDGSISATDSAELLVPSIIEQMNQYRGVTATYIVAYRQGDLEALRRAARTLNLAPTSDVVH